MPDRKPRKIAVQNPINTVRRPPRLPPGNQIAVEITGTPKLKAKLVTASDSFSTPPWSCVTGIQKSADGNSPSVGRKGTELKNSVNCRRKSARLASRANLSCPDVQTEKRVTRSSVRGDRFVNSQDSAYDVVSGKEERGITESKSWEKSGKGSRRSDRLVDRAKVNRVTRSSTRRNKVEIIEISDSDCEEDSGKSARILSKEQEPKAGVDSCKENIGNIEKRVTRSSSRKQMGQFVEKASNVRSNRQQEMVMPDKTKGRGDDELSMKKNDVDDCGVVRNGDRKCKQNARVGEKRKRYQLEEEFDIVQGWTKDQELALRRAYFTANPTPHFWKEVARMVPGKSAKECFDRIHSDILTPCQPRTRSRPKSKALSPILFSASKLLSPSEKSKKLISRRRRTLVAQKTVRQLLQKQHNEDRDYEADLFSVLEPATGSSPLNFKETTPFPSPAPNEGSSVLTTCKQTSSSARGKQRSRLNSMQNAGFVSPPVLKQIKNKALHEKYIDQLHYRDAKRNTAAIRKARNGKDQIDEKVSLLRPNLVKVAKDALVSDAQDAISKLRSLQSGRNESLDDDDNACLSDVNEDEDEDDELC